MTRISVVGIVIVVLLALPALPFQALQSPAYAEASAREQLAFGIQAAQLGLWREAAYRFERAIETRPRLAIAHNNLAVACEHLGRSDCARSAYERALALMPNALWIRENYDRFQELHPR